MHALRVAENGEGEYLEGNTGRERERQRERDLLNKGKYS